MAANQFKGFAIGGGPGSPNTLTPSAWAALTTLLANGFQPGIALSEQVNTALRQTTSMAAALAQFTANNQAADVNDNGDIATLVALIQAAIDARVTAQQHWHTGDFKLSWLPFEQAGWKWANGQNINRAGEGAALFAAIGTTYGAGNGSTTFTLPDARGEFFRGWDNGRGVDGGRVIGSAQGDMIKSHQHGLDNRILLEGGSGGPGGTTSGDAAIAPPTDAFGGAETRPRNIALNVLIKL